MNDVELDYFGLNHLGWIRAIRHQGSDHLQEFIGMLVKSVVSRNSRLIRI